MTYSLSCSPAWARGLLRLTISTLFVLPGCASWLLGADGQAAATPVAPDAGGPVPVGDGGTCASDRKRCGDLCARPSDPAFGCTATDCVPCTVLGGVAMCEADGHCGLARCNEGYRLSTDQTKCEPVASPLCGNGARDGDESCDDGNTASGDGCSSACQAEPLYICTGVGPGSCVPAPAQWAQQAYVKASNTDAGDFFGRSIALSADGNTLAVGAPYEDSNARGINSDQNDNTESKAGAVYMFQRQGGVWAFQSYLKASNADADDTFGKEVAISSDGNVLVVGSPNESSSARGVNTSQFNNDAELAGAAYIFRRSSGTWQQEAYLKASRGEAFDTFGDAVSISGDGSTVAVGAPWEDSASVGINGDEDNNQADSAGAAYVFRRATSTWQQEAYVKASNTAAKDSFGHRLALSHDGNLLAVAAAYEGSSGKGVNAAQGPRNASGSGAVYVFQRAASAWAQTTYVKASNAEVADYFGAALALSADGTVLAVGAWGEDSSSTGLLGDPNNNSNTNAGAAYVFRRAGSNWSQEAYIKYSENIAQSEFGAHLALSADGRALFVSAISHGSEAQHVVELRRFGSAWTYGARLQASNTERGDVFGWTLAPSSDGRTLAVGAPFESSSSRAINGNQTDNSAAEAGAGYVFVR